MVDLKNVTLVNIDSCADWNSKNNPRIASISKIVPHLLNEYNFGDVLIINQFGKNRDLINEKFDVLWPYNFDEEERNFNWYNNFVVKKLPFLIKTEFYLIIQWDGFPINKNEFDYNFFNYDFIGGGIRELNGGFSLRNTEVMINLSKNIDLSETGVEDIFYSSISENSSIKWPNAKITSKFCNFLNEDIISFGWHNSSYQSKHKLQSYYKITNLFNDIECNILSDYCMLKSCSTLNWKRISGKAEYFDIKRYALEYEESFFINF